MNIDDFKKAKIEAMKAHDKDTVTAFNALINKLMLFNIEKRSKGEEMSDADYVQILKKTQKELFEEKDAFEKAGRAARSQLRGQRQHAPRHFGISLSAEQLHGAFG